MSYTKQNFVSGQILTAAHMNHIEDGIAAVDCVSPTITATETATGVDLTITDANGTKKVSLKNGKDSTSGAVSGGTAAKSFKLMTLGDSITQLGTQDRGWVKYFIESTGCTLVANVAVNGAVLSDSSNTTYDGNPVQGTQDNNVLGNQVQKIINNGYEAPDVILIAIGTNGGISISKDDIKNAYYNASGDLIALESVDRKTHAGAFRYASEKLHELYPDALIFWCAPIMGHQKKRPAQTAVTYYESLKTAVDFTGQLMIDTIHCGINGVNEKQNEAGEYLVDGLHPTIKGAKKIGYYNASVVKSFLGIGSGLTTEEKQYMISLFSQTAYANAGMQKTYNALKTAWGVTEIEPDTPISPDPEKPNAEIKTVLSTNTYETWSTSTSPAKGYNLPFTPKVDMTLKGLRFKLMSTAAKTLRIVVHDTVQSLDLQEVVTSIAQNTTDGNEVNVALNVALTAGRFYKIWIGTSDGSSVLYSPNVQDSDIAENGYFSVTRNSDSDYFSNNRLLKYGGYVSFTSTSSGSSEPDISETGEKTILTTKEYYTWNINTPLSSGYNLPFTPKVNMTLKGLRFKLKSDAAATLRVVIYDTVESKDLAEATADIVQNTTAGNEVNVAFDVALTAGRFYKIWIGTKNETKVLYYPLVPDDLVVENEYFSISRDTVDDYHWKNGKVKYSGYVTFTTA